MSERLRVLVITTIPQTMAAFFEKQLRHLAEEGFEVHAVSSPGPALDHLDVGPSVIRHGLFMERKPSPVQDLKSLSNLLRLMRDVRPHIVHAHTPKAGLLGMLASRIAGVPVRLYTVHGLPLETRSGLKRRILEWAERSSARSSTRTYAVSPSVRNSVIKWELCPAAKVSILGDGSCSGVDLDRFQPFADSSRRAAVREALGIPGSAPVATFIGRLSRDKGVEVLADAWSQVSRMVPDLHLVVAGEHDETDPVSAAALEVLRSDARIHLPGNVPAADVPALYSASDFTVLPTFREGLSQVAIESGAMGLPIVSCRVCGLDSVLDGVTGILVAPRDADALAEAMAALAGDARLRSRLGAAAKARIRGHYSDRRVNRLWIGEYRRLARESFPGAGEPAAMQVES
jgi:glycosyltransferase involved in cell wall biosynthesis